MVAQTSCENSGSCSGQDSFINRHPRVKIPPKGYLGPSFYCLICEVMATTEYMFLQHLDGNVHKDGLSSTAGIGSFQSVPLLGAGRPLPPPEQYFVIDNPKYPELPEGYYICRVCQMYYKSYGGLRNLDQLEKHYCSKILGQ